MGQIMGPRDCFPSKLPDGRIVINERCKCGLMRTDHAGVLGHGAGPPDSRCEKFSFDERVFAMDNDRVNAIKGPAKDLSRARSRTCVVSAMSTPEWLILRFNLPDGSVFEFKTDDHTTINHVADVAKMAKKRVR